MKPEPDFKGYNKGEFKNGNPTEDIICENIPRGKLEKDCPKIPIFFPYEPFRQSYNTMPKRVKDFFDKINPGFSLPFLISHKEVLKCRDELYFYLIQFENLTVDHINLPSYTRKRYSGYLYCYETDNEKQMEVLKEMISKASRPSWKYQTKVYWCPNGCGKKSVPHVKNNVIGGKQQYERETYKKCDKCGFIFDIKKKILSVKEKD